MPVNAIIVPYLKFFKNKGLDFVFPEGTGFVKKSDFDLPAYAVSLGRGWVSSSLPRFPASPLPGRPGPLILSWKVAAQCQRHRRRIVPPALPVSP